MDDVRNSQVEVVYVRCSVEQVYGLGVEQESVWRVVAGRVGGMVCKVDGVWLCSVDGSGCVYEVEQTQTMWSILG